MRAVGVVEGARLLTRGVHGAALGHHPDDLGKDAAVEAQHATLAVHAAHCTDDRVVGVLVELKPRLDLHAHTLSTPLQRL
jgi:hypothetical protein